MEHLTPSDYLEQPYKRFLIHDSELNMFTAGIEEFDGCVADADTIEGALNQLEQNALAWLETEIEAGHEIPAPAILADPPQHSGRVSLRLPLDLHRQAAEHAAKNGTSLNTTLVAAVSYYLGASQIADSARAASVRLGSSDMGSPGMAVYYYVKGSYIHTSAVNPPDSRVLDSGLSGLRVESTSSAVTNPGKVN